MTIALYFMLALTFLSGFFLGFLSAISLQKKLLRELIKQVEEANITSLKEQNS